MTKPGAIDLPPRLGALIGPASELPHLPQALTHPSFANEQRKTSEPLDAQSDYQRLEFLGDAVLGFVVGEALMTRFPDAREGELSQLRAQLVSTDALAAFAREVGLGSALRLGRGASASHDRDQASVLADALEAVIAAVHLDKGLDAARSLILDIVDRGLAKPRSTRDPKSELQERVQARGGVAPKYRLVSSTGPDHARDFVVEVEVLGKMLASGTGKSKKAAEQAAAKIALGLLDAP
jgi:ribonuclease-3